MSDDMAMVQKSKHPIGATSFDHRGTQLQICGVDIQSKDLLEISDARGGTEVTHRSLPVAADDVHNLSAISAFCLLQERENQLSYAIDALWNPERHVPRVQSIQVALTIERAVKSAAGMSVDPENAWAAGICRKVCKKQRHTEIMQLEQCNVGHLNRYNHEGCCHSLKTSTLQMQRCLVGRIAWLHLRSQLRRGDGMRIAWSLEISLHASA